MVGYKDEGKIFPLCLGFSNVSELALERYGAKYEKIY